MRLATVFNTVPTLLPNSHKEVRLNTSLGVVNSIQPQIIFGGADGPESTSTVRQQLSHFILYMGLLRNIFPKLN